jgi:hypothetical protein
MPHSRIVRPRVFTAASVSALVLAAAAATGCKSRGSHHDSPPPSPAPAPSNANNDPPFHPLHPSHLNQSNGKGGFNPPLPAPPPSAIAALKATIFDVLPEEIKLAALKAENGHCGEFEVGGEKLFLDCMTEDYGKVAGAAHPVASAEELKSLRGQHNLPAVVDHRKDNTEGVIMNQGRSSACTAFSLTAAVDHAAAHFLGQAPTLSPMHAWARYHTASMKLAEDHNVNRGLSEMKDFPFDARLANEWMKNEKRPDPHEVRRADEKALFEITNFTRLDPGNMSEIKAALAAGQDVWFAIKAAHGLMKPKKNSDGESMVPDFDFRKLPNFKGGHALLLSGYEDTPKGTFYLIHNSWGPKWGTDGYAWIWEKTLHTNIAEAYVLQVHPTELAHVKRAPAVHAFSNCTSGLSPDATTTQCVPPCSDGGPRVNGVCPTAGQCPDGQVNLDGKCEVSGPAMSKTLSDGTKVTCGLSGCTYVVPSGQSSCTSADGCTISCAAPRYMLGSGPRGLTCNG